jgi:hypothetical protein
MGKIERAALATALTLAWLAAGVGIISGIPEAARFGVDMLAAACMTLFLWCGLVIGIRQVWKLVFEARP